MSTRRGTTSLVGHPLRPMGSSRTRGPYILGRRWQTRQPTEQYRARITTTSFIALTELSRSAIRWPLSGWFGDSGRPDHQLDDRMVRLRPERNSISYCRFGMLMFVSVLGFGSTASCDSNGDPIPVAPRDVDDVFGSVRQRWFQPQASWPRARPVVVGDVVVFGTGDQRLIARDRQTGAARWATRVSSYFPDDTAPISGLDRGLRPSRPLLRRSVWQLVASTLSPRAG